MSRAERERQRLADERWPHLRDFIAHEIPSLFFQRVNAFNLGLRVVVLDMPHEKKKALAANVADFISYFTQRFDDVHMILDGFSAEVPVGKIAYEGDQQPGVRRMKLLYAELVRLIRIVEDDWQP